MKLGCSLYWCWAALITGDLYLFGIHNFEAFLIASILLNMVPGSDTFYVLGRSIAQGRSIGIASVFGISSGTLIHTVMAAVGLSAIVTASATAFLIIKLIGSIYLIYLGVKFFFMSSLKTINSPSLSSSGFSSAFKQGLLTNVLNPKIAMFFIAFLPQFVSPDTQSKMASFLVLGLTFVVSSTIWSLGLAWFSATISSKLRASPKYLNYLNKVAGTILVGIGVRLAVFDQ